MGWAGLALAALLLLGNAFFVGAQFALITARRDQVEPLARRGSRGARITLGQMRRLPTMLAGSQLGIAACSLGLGAVAEPSIAHLLEGVFDGVGLPESLHHPVAFLIALGAVAYLHMVIGEMVPKNLALAGPLRAALVLGPFMAVWVATTRPLLRAINAVAGAVLRLFRVEPKDELAAAFTSEELAELITESTMEGLLDPASHARLTRALALERRTAWDVTIPLDRTVTVGEDTTPSQLEELVARTGFSRFPVRAAGALVGYLHAKDLLGLGPDQRDGPIPTALRRPMVTVEAELPLTTAFTVLQRAGTHIGSVAQDGAVTGVIALEDILEELVGEVHDASHPDERSASTTGRSSDSPTKIRDAPDMP